VDAHNIAAHGRSFDEYRLLFALQHNDCRKRILGVGDGPSSFNAEASRRSWQVVSVDPLYAESPRDIAHRIDGALDSMITAVSLAPRHWTWSYFRDRDTLRSHRQQTAGTFLADFTSRAGGSRYVAGSLPQLPFASHSFDLALCSHLLFSWSGALSVRFHIDAVAEMLRVAREVRIVPTSRNLGAVRCRCAETVAHEFATRGFAVRLQCADRLLASASTERLVIERS
jgi:hypothetical protein